MKTETKKVRGTKENGSKVEGSADVPRYESVADLTEHESVANILSMFHSGNDIRLMNDVRTGLVGKKVSATKAENKLLRDQAAAAKELDRKYRAGEIDADEYFEQLPYILGTEGEDEG